MNLRTFLQIIVTSCVLMFGVVGMAEPVSAQGIRVEVRSIAASRNGQSFDPKLNDLKKQLKGPAFAGYTNFKQVSVVQLSLGNKKAKSQKLPNGSVMNLTFLGKVANLYKLGLNIPKKLNTTISLSRGSYFFQAGLKYKNSILLLAIRVK